MSGGAKRRPGPCAVYRHFDAAGNLLYIGCSVDPATRASSHRLTSSWVLQTVRIEVDWFPGPEEAEAAERSAIAAEKPAHNVTHNPGRRNKGFGVKRGPQARTIHKQRLQQQDSKRKPLKEAS